MRYLTPCKLMEYSLRVLTLCSHRKELATSFLGGLKKKNVLDRTASQLQKGVFCNFLPISLIQTGNGTALYNCINSSKCEI